MDLADPLLKGLWCKWQNLVNFPVMVVFSWLLDVKKLHRFVVFVYLFSKEVHTRGLLLVYFFFIQNLL